jgi:hypothetical protein
MAKLSMSVDVNAPADEVWPVVGDFTGLDRWHPAVERCDANSGTAGSTRDLHLAGGGLIRERLESVDEKGQSLTYVILDGPLPVQDYVSTLRVTGDGGRCRVEWSSEFKPAGLPEPEAVKTMEGVYKAGLDNLKTMFGA